MIVRTGGTESTEYYAEMTPQLNGQVSSGHGITEVVSREQTT